MSHFATLRNVSNVLRARSCISVTSLTNPCASTIVPYQVNSAPILSLSTSSLGERHFSTMEAKRAKTLFEDLGVTKDAVALTTGAPGERHLKQVAELVGKASQHLMKTNWGDDLSYLQYGPKQGSPRFREELAKFLSEGYGDKIDSQSLVVTSGATHGFHLVASVLIPNGAPVFVEDPTYFIAIDIAKKDLGREVIGVPTDDEGINMEVLEARLQEYQAKFSQNVNEKQPYWGMIYLIPTYHNPRGYCIPPARCRALVEMARKYKVIIFCDDVYNLLHFTPDSVAPLRLLGYDKPSDPGYQGNVVSNGSFSKILSPGMRLGWIEAGEPVVKLLVGSNILWSAGSSNHYASEIVASALEMGLEQAYLKKLCAEYRDIIEAVSQTMKDNLPASVTFNTPVGGYFIWIQMPEGANAAAVIGESIKQYNVKALKGDMCSASGGATNCIRISFSHYPKDVLVDGVRKLCKCISEHVEKL